MEAWDGLGCQTWRPCLCCVHCSFACAAVTAANDTASLRVSSGRRRLRIGVDLQESEGPGEGWRKIFRLGERESKREQERNSERERKRVSEREGAPDVWTIKARFIASGRRPSDGLERSLPEDRPGAGWPRACRGLPCAAGRQKPQWSSWPSGAAAADRVPAPAGPCRAGCDVPWQLGAARYRGPGRSLAAVAEPRRVQRACPAGTVL